MTPAVTIGQGTNSMRTGADETNPARPDQKNNVMKPQTIALPSSTSHSEALSENSLPSLTT
jgi:hypothetical protein